MQTSGTALIDPIEIFKKVGLSAGMRVADMGCGRTGHFVFPAARVVGEKGIVYAVDILKDVLHSLGSWVKSEGLENVQTIWSDIEKINKTPIPAKSVNACFFMNVVSHLKDKNGALSEAARLIKDDGRVVVVDWSKSLGTLGPQAGVSADPQKVVEMAESCGLRLVENFSCSDYHYCLLFKKA